MKGGGDMGKQRTVTVYACGHFLVDLACAFAMLRFVRGTPVRAEAVLLYNFTTILRISTVNSGSLRTYQDAHLISAYALNAVTWAVDKGYITSSSERENKISPLDNATRAELAIMLHRYISY